MNDLTLLPENPVAVLTDAKTYSEFYAKMKAETDAFVPDISTVKGRGEIAALAYKVTRTKTAIDAAGKKLNEEARDKINAVDASRRKIREELDALADAVRKPLTEWEEAEDQRKELAKLVMDNIAMTAQDINGLPSETIRASLRVLENLTVDPDVHRDGLDAAIAAKTASFAKLQIALDAALKSEADAAELSRLRAEAEAREIAERERIEREQAAQAEHERIERERIVAAKREQEAADREACAIETARAEALAKAQREHAAELAKIEAENRRLADAETARLAAEERTKSEEAARQADREHRGKIMKAAKEAIMELDPNGISEAVARKIVLAIVAGEIPAVTLRF